MPRTHLSLARGCSFWIWDSSSVLRTMRQGADGLRSGSASSTGTVGTSPCLANCPLVRSPAPHSTTTGPSQIARVVPADYRVRYVQLGIPDMHRRLPRLAAEEDIDFFCLTDVDMSRPTGRSKLPSTFLECKYPFSSCFEVPPNQQAAIGPRLATERTTS